jgi:hypothetical protein
MDAVWIGLLQWPAMIVTIAATYFVASKVTWKRHLSFWCYLVSNGLWIAWSVHDGAVALIALQLALAALNIRGVVKTDE